MEKLVEIDFQGMQGTPQLQASIEEQVAKLEERFARITACRVVVKGPGAHHRTGLYEVNILSLLKIISGRRYDGVLKGSAQ
ncbi:MAG: HPF/RaiA family ribosome-associated protein [Rhodoplanes sp.]